MKKVFFTLLLIVGVVLSSFSQSPILQLTESTTSTSFLLSVNDIHFVVERGTGSEIISINPSVRYIVDEDLTTLATLGCGDLFQVTVRQTGKAKLLNRRYVKRVNIDRNGNTYVTSEIAESKIKTRDDVTESLATLAATIAVCSSGGGGTNQTLVYTPSTNALTISAGNTQQLDDLDDIEFGTGVPTVTPTAPDDPFVYMDNSTGFLYTFSGGTWTQVGAELEVLQVAGAPSTAPSVANPQILAQNTLTGILSYWNGTGWIEVGSTQFITIDYANDSLSLTDDPSSVWLGEYRDVSEIAGIPSVAPTTGNPQTLAQNTTNGDLYAWDGTAWALVGKTPLLSLNSTTDSLSLTDDPTSVWLGSYLDVRRFNGVPTGPPTTNLPQTVAQDTSLNDGHLYYWDGSKWVKVGEEQEEYWIVQTGHGFTLNSYGYNPVAITAGGVIAANTDGTGSDRPNLHTSYIVEIRNDSLRLQDHGPLVVPGGHGLTTGSLYWLQADGTQADTAYMLQDTLVDDLLSVVYNDSFLYLQNIRPFISTPSETTTQLDTLPWLRSIDQTDRAGFRNDALNRFTIDMDGYISMDAKEDVTSINARIGAIESAFSVNSYGVNIDGGITYKVETVTAATHTVINENYLLRLDPAANDIIVTLIDAAFEEGKEFVLFNDTNSPDKSTIISAGGLINGATTYNMPPGDIVSFKAINGNWVAVRAGNRYLRDRDGDSYAGYQWDDAFNFYGPNPTDQAIEEIGSINNGYTRFQYYNQDSTLYGYFQTALGTTRLFQGQVGVDTFFWEMSNGYIHNDLGFRNRVTPVSSTTYASLLDDNTLILDPSVNAADMTVTLPLLINIDGLELTYRAINNGTNSVTLDPQGTQLIDGQANLVMKEEECVTLFFYDENWWTKSRNQVDVVEPYYKEDLVSDNTVQLSNGTSAWFWRCPPHLVGRTITEVSYACATPSTNAGGVASLACFTQVNGTDLFGATFFGGDQVITDTDTHVLALGDKIEVRFLEIGGDFPEGLYITLKLE